jgi:threo-3-hydroxy-L-aspartate ammonia-lyase
MNEAVRLAEPVGGFLSRLAVVRARLEEHAAAGPPPGLTDPDPGATERWEAGQVWAHLAEFPHYWLGQIAAILDARADGRADPIPFGRTKTDPGRLAAIERDRDQDPEALLRRVTDGIAAAETTIRDWQPDAWRAIGMHPRRGVMTVGEILDSFVIGHLEEHADQLDLLRVRSELVSIDRIRAAAARIAGVAVRTPLLAWDARTWLKPESLQPVGAFKMRGAYARLTSLSDAERAAGVITYSSGNHAQAVARAARLLGVRAVIVMPENAPAIKVAGVRRDGAEIVTTGPASDERHAVAERLAAEHGYTMLPPYDDPEVIAGQGTAGLEIVEDLPNVTSVLVPIGGGGLIAGIAAAVKALAPGARIVGVEPEDAADARDSLAAGEIIAWPAERIARTLADGLRVTAVGRLPFAHMRAFVDEIVTVSDDELRNAMRALATRARLVVEPSGAAAMAAHLGGRAPQPEEDDARVVILSGGNVDPLLLAEVLRDEPEPAPNANQT